MPKTIKELIRTVIKKYSQQGELEAYSKAVKIGLTIPERFLIKKWFKKKGKILDVGCGAGREAIALAKKGFDVVGIDLVPAMIKKAKLLAKKYKVQVQFKVGNATNLEFPNNSFNYVLMLAQMIEHIPKRTNRIKALKEARRVLKKNGILIFSTHTRGSKFKYRIYWLFINSYRKLLMLALRKKYLGLELGDKFITQVSAIKTKGKAFLHIYTLNEAIEDAKKAGFKIEEIISKEEIEKNIINEKLRKKGLNVFYVCRKT